MTDLDSHDQLMRDLTVEQFGQPVRQYHKPEPVEPEAVGWRRLKAVRRELAELDRQQRKAG